MKAHVFRDFNYAPSPVTSVCSNNATVVAFRRSHIVEFVDSLTLKHFVRHDIGLAIVQSAFLDLNSVVCLSECGSVVVLDVATLERTVYDLSAIHIDAKFSEVAFAERAFYYVTAKNELCEWRGGATAVLHRAASTVSAMLASGHGVLLGAADGWIRVYQRGQCTAEINVKGRPSRICRCADGDYVAVLDNGSAVLFDVENSVVFDTVEIRKNPLNVVCYFDGFVHISGQDSRIISYDVTARRFIKCAQADFHESEVTCMALDNERIVTAGEDTMLVFNTLLNGKYVSRRAYDSSVCCGTTSNYFYATAGRSINLYKLDGDAAAGGGASKFEAPADGKVTFQISPHVLEKINLKQAAISFFLKFSTKEAPTAVAISPNERYLAYSTSEETLLYNLFQGSRLGIEKIRAFGPALQVALTDKYLAVLGISKQLTLLDLATLRAVAEVPFEDLRERIAIDDSVVVMSNLKQIIPLDSPGSVQALGCEHTIGEIRAGPSGLSMLTYDDCGRCMLGALEDGRVVEQRLDEDVRGAISHTSGTVFFSDRFLYMLEGGRLKKYDFGPIISGVLAFRGELVVLQTSWNYLKQKFKPSVFKPKFSNK